MEAAAKLQNYLTSHFAGCSHINPMHTFVRCGASSGIITLLFKCTCVSPFEEVDVTEMEF